MTAAAFDTLKLARALRDATFTAEQAEGLAEAIAEVLKGDLATKPDLRETQVRLETHLREVEAGLTAKLREVELRLKADIEASKAELIKWMFGTIGFQTLIILGAVITLARIVAK